MNLFALLVRLYRTDSLLVLRTALSFRRHDPSVSPRGRGKAQQRYGVVCREMERRERGRRIRTRARSLLHWCVGT